ncbi:MAG: glycosyltransferase family protein [bacterium]
MTQKKRIAYTLSGEGGGHASRNLFIIEKLAEQGHTIDIFTYKRSYHEYSKIFANHPLIHLFKIPGLEFRYSKGKLAKISTAFANTRQILTAPLIIGKLAKLITSNHYDLCIVDTEFFFSRAAKKCKIPTVQINHIPMFPYGKITLPSSLKMQMACYNIAIKFYMPMSDLILTNAFYTATNYTRKNIKYIGPVLKKEIFKQTPSDDGYILVYLKESIAPFCFPALAENSQQKFIVFADNPNNYKKYPNITMKTIGLQSNFVHDLAHCTAVIGVAGIDLPSEAIYLEKPILGIYEEGQFEQRINGFQIKQCGIGIQIGSRNVTAGTIKQFIKAIPKFHNGIRKYKQTTFKIGNTEVLNYLEPYLK